MELKTVFQSTEPSNRNVIWLQLINGVLIQKVFTSHGWQIVGSPTATPSECTNTVNSTNADSDYVSPSSLYKEYVDNGGQKTKEEFNNELFNLIG